MQIRQARDIAKQHGADRIVIVASRRTDMPAFYVGEIVRGLRDGAFHPQPMMQKPWELRFRPEDIHSVGLWSQDFGAWIRRRREIRDLPYRYWYRFTILPDDPVTKPKAPSVQEQLRQLEELVKTDGPDAVSVFIDPLIEYRPLRSADWRGNWTERAIEPIVRRAAELGLGRVTVSVLDRYAKIEKRAAALGVQFRFLDPARGEDRQAIVRMLTPVKDLAERYGLKDFTCCERFLSSSGITKAGACVDGKRLTRLFSPGASQDPDQGQRRKLGCGCTRAIDVGRYAQSGEWSHACRHDCPQCYARP